MKKAVFGTWFVLILIVWVFFLVIPTSQVMVSIELCIVFFWTAGMAVGYCFGASAREEKMSHYDD